MLQRLLLFSCIRLVFLLLLVLQFLKYFLLMLVRLLHNSLGRNILLVFVRNSYLDILVVGLGIGFDHILVDIRLGIDPFLVVLEALVPRIDPFLLVVVDFVLEDILLVVVVVLVVGFPLKVSFLVFLVVARVDILRSLLLLDLLRRLFPLVIFLRFVIVL